MTVVIRISLLTVDSPGGDSWGISERLLTHVDG